MQMLNKPHGGVFGLSNNFLLLSLAREGLDIILKQNSDLPKKALVPAFTCETIITPFLNNGWRVGFYPVSKQLKLNVHALREICSEFEPSIIVTHPFFGLDFEEYELCELKELSKKGHLIVLDKTQNIFSNQIVEGNSYIIGSLRKWFNIPDGAFIQSSTMDLKCFKDNLTENNTFLNYQVDAMYIRGVGNAMDDDILKTISRHIYKSAVISIENNSCEHHKMADLSMRILNKQDLHHAAIQREANFRFLQNNLRKSTQLEPVYSNIPNKNFVPLYFPLFAKHRKELQEDLEKNQIYAPIIWPAYNNSVIVNEDIQYIYDHILAIPIDQRYDQTDMKRVSDVINRFALSV